MKNLNRLNEYRTPYPLSGETGDEFNGCFLIPGPNKYLFKVIASSEMKWDHVSVSLKNRCPNWHEMSYVKQLFFEDHEVCYQLHGIEIPVHLILINPPDCVFLEVREQV